MKAYLEELNKRLLQSIDEYYPVGLAQGQIGISIYFYHLFRIEKNENYKVIADQLLDNSLVSISLDSSISVENGLAGISLGIIYLIKKGFVKGDLNELLENIDNVIFKHLAFTQSNLSFQREELLHLIYYLSVRLRDQKEKNDIYIYQELIIKTINIFTDKLSDNFFNEGFSFSVYNFHLPLFTYILSCLLKLNFYNNRIYKILEEFEYSILSKIPILHANRLFMLCGILPLVPYMKNPKWELHAQLLHREINLQVIFNKEINNKHIFVGNGLPLIYLLLYYLENYHPKYKICYNPQDFQDKIISSEAWESLFAQNNFFEAHQGLLEGFPGVQLVLSHIQKRGI